MAENQKPGCCDVRRREFDDELRQAQDGFREGDTARVVDVMITSAAKSKACEIRHGRSNPEEE